MRAAFLHSYPGQAMLAVALVHAVLLPLLTTDRIGPYAYGVTALILSCTALLLLGRRMARSIAGLRTALTRFGAGSDDATPFTEAKSTGLEGLQRGLDNLLRRVVRREQRLKAAYRVVEHESAASHALAQQLSRSQRIARIGSWEWQRASGGIACSGEALRILGIDAEQSNPAPSVIRGLIHREDRRALSRWLVQLTRGDASQGVEVRLSDEGGEARHVHLLGEAMLERQRDMSSAWWARSRTRPSARARSSRCIALRYFDVLTELPNRSRFHEKLAETLEAAERDGSSFAIMFLDLDQFKRINDTLGHAVGDDLLRVIAQRLTRSLRAGRHGRADARARQSTATYAGRAATSSSCC